MTIGQYWAWKYGDKPKSTEELIRTLAKCAGGDGNFLLNIGPIGDGSLDSGQAERLRGIGKWLSVNGRAIYGARGGPWKPGKYGVCTCSGPRVNIIVLDGAMTEINLPALPVTVTDCRLHGAPIMHRTAGGIFNVALPPALKNEPARIVELRIDGNAVAIEPIAVSA